MQARKRFFSGRETSLSLGIKDFSANETVLEVTEGRVGFGTTQAAYQLTVNGNMQLHNALYDYTNSPGEQGLTLISTGSSVAWGTPEITFGGITIQEEGVTVGSAGSVQTLNFVGDSVTADSFLGIATITVDPFDPVGDNTYVQFNANGEIWCVGEAEGYHIGAVSSESLAKDRAEDCIAEFYYQSRYYYLCKHHGLLLATCAELTEVLLLVLRSLVAKCLRRNNFNVGSNRLNAPILSLPKKVSG